MVTGAKVTVDAPDQRADVLGGVADERAEQQHDLAEACSTIRTLRDDLIALGLDPRHGQPGRHAECDGLRLAAFDGRQPAERAPRLPDRVPCRAGRPLLARHVQLLRGCRSTRGTICRSATGRRRQPGAARQHPAVGERSGQRAVFEEVFSRRRDEPPRLGPLRSQPAQRSGLPIGGNSLFAFSEEVRAILRGKFGGVLFLDGGNVWAEAWDIGPARSALRGGSRAALSDADRPDPLRCRATSSIPIDGLLVERRAATRRWRIHFSIGQAF